MPTPLISRSSENYGEAYSDHLFEQYKLYVESAEKISDRRSKANSFALGISGALLSVWGFIPTSPISHSDEIARTALCSLGVLLCFIWWFMIRSYKQINSGKFQVIHKLEQELPVALYSHEWEMLGSGDNHKTYFPFSHIEMKIPWIVGFVYMLLGSLAWFV
jgi:hypothetical protein